MNVHSLCLLLATAAPAFAALPFEAQTIDSKISIGYGLAIADVDGDKKDDILLADAKEIVWYRNPSWEKAVIAKNLTLRDNVCLAARDCKLRNPLTDHAARCDFLRIIDAGDEACAGLGEQRFGGDAADAGGGACHHDVRHVSVNLCSVNYTMHSWTARAGQAMGGAWQRLRPTTMATCGTR